MREINVEMRGDQMPESIDFGDPLNSRRLLRPENVDSNSSSKAFFCISGNCMEAAGIEEEGYVLVDFTKFPKPPRHKSKGGDGSYDCCLCKLMSHEGEGSVGVKAYGGKWGAWHSIGTRYTPEGNPHPPFQWGWFADKIYGAVIASYNKHGQLIWQRDPKEFLDRLSEEPSIFGDNVGDPIAL